MAEQKEQDDCRPFPIQEEHYSRLNQGKSCTVPWWLAEIAYEDYTERFGTGQSLERMAERGGFSRSELIGQIRKVRRISNEELNK